MDLFKNAPIFFLEDNDFTRDGAMIYKTHKPVLIMIMNSGCPHCHNAAPEFVKFAKGAKDVLSAVIMTDGAPSERALGARVEKGIAPKMRGVPTFVLFRNGKYIKTFEGDRTAREFAKFASS